MCIFSGANTPMFLTLIPCVILFVGWMKLWSRRCARKYPNHDDHRHTDHYHHDFAVNFGVMMGMLGISLVWLVLMQTAFAFMC